MSKFIKAAPNVQEQEAKNRANQRSMMVLLFGFVFALIGGYLCSDNYRWLSKGTEAIGKVTGHNSSDNLRCPIVQFTAANGQQVTFTSRRCSTGGIADKGQEISVMYLADNPHMADLKPGLGAWSLALLFLGIGVGLCGLFIRARFFSSPPAPAEQFITTNKE